MGKERPNRAVEFMNLADVIVRKVHVNPKFWEDFRGELSRLSSNLYDEVLWSSTSYPQGMRALLWGEDKNHCPVSLYVDSCVPYGVVRSEDNYESAVAAGRV